MTEPRPDGLPNRLVIWAFPVLVMVGFAILVVLAVNGSSTGMLWSTFHLGPDPDLLLGRPRAIRTDEWLVQSGYVVSQVAQRFPELNQGFPGGMDATIMNDLPVRDWSNLFRPHTWGFLVLGLDRGMAVRWWLPAATMLVTTHLFVVSVLPRRPGLAAVLALTVVFQPLVQWWWLPVVPLPVAFGFASVTAVLWAIKSQSRLGPVVLAVLSGYLAVAMAMSIYVPYMVPAVLVAVAYIAGLILAASTGSARLSPRTLAIRLVPLASSAALATVVLALWLASRRDTVEALLSTVYPGERLTPPGSGGGVDGLASLMSAPFQRSLEFDVVDGLGVNASEASSPVLFAVFLVIPVIAVIVRQWRSRRSLDFVSLCLLLMLGIVLAYMFVPGWEPVAHLMGLDRTLPQRLRLALVMLGVMLFVELTRHLEGSSIRLPWGVSVAGGLVVAGSYAWTLKYLRDQGSAAADATSAVAVSAVLVVAIVIVARRYFLAAAVGLLLASLAVGAGVNPLYSGVYDLRSQTKSGRAIAHLEKRNPGSAWVAVGSYIPRTILVESGVLTYSGVQTYPSREMWSQIDPTGRRENAWNRLAQVNWVAGTGDPDPRQPDGGILDAIDLTFDSCASFAQEHVQFAIVDGAPLAQPCAELIRTVRQGPSQHWIYRVVASPPAS